MRYRAGFGLWVIAAMGCNDSLAVRELSAGSGEFAVGSDNYSGATSISLLDDQGEVSQDDWLSSKVQNPKLRTPLSDDVVFPTVSTDAQILTTIERGLGVITRFDLRDGRVLGQLRSDDSAQDDDDQAAYHSNPQDVYFVSEDSAWLTRWEPNPNSDVEPRERGNDLIEWNPKTWQRSDRRIDLSPLNQQIQEEQFDQDGQRTGSVEATAYASPAAIVPVGGDYAAVGVTGITRSYHYAEGKLAIVDLKRGRLVSTLELDGLSNCGELRPVPAEPASVIVSCIGAYGDGGATAGIVKVAVDDAGQAEIQHAFRKAEHEDAANTNSNVASLGGDIVVAVAAGQIDPETMKPVQVDRLYRLDLASGEQEELWESDGAFVLGTPAFAPRTGLLLVPDAGNRDQPLTGVQRFHVGDKREVDHDDFVEVAAETGLAARRALAL